MKKFGMDLQTFASDKAENKVKYGIDRFHYAVETSDDVYDTPVHIPGARTLTLTPSGEQSTVYADNQKYWVITSNQGFDGDLEFVRIPEHFEKEVLGQEIEDDTYIQIEKRDSNIKRVACGWRFRGNEYDVYTWVYGCTFNRPTSEYNTTEETSDPQFDTLSMNAAGLTGSNVVRIKTTKDTPQSVIDKWFEKVRFPGDGLGE